MSATAQDVTVEAEVSRSFVGVGSSIHLTVTVNGTQSVDAPQLPAIEGFDVQYLGPASRVSIVNGKYSTSKAFTYSLLALKEGSFEIPVFLITINGQTYETQAIPVTVSDTFSGAQSSSTGTAGQEGAVTLKNKIFMVMKAAKDRVYVNQAVPVKIFLFVSDLSVQDVQYPDFEKVGFVGGDFFKPQQYEQVVNGVRYNVVEFDTIIYPSRGGELLLGPARIGCNILVRTSPPSPRGGLDGSFFGDDFFDSLFERAEKRPLTLESEPVRLEVLPLPEAGKPAAFTGAVGKFDFEVSVSPTDVREGDPITVKMRVSGEGNFKSVTMPSLPKQDDLKTYEPEIREDEQGKTAELVVIPESSRVVLLPLIEFSYFDTALKQYQTIRKGPFPVKVAKPDKRDPFKVVGLDQPSAAAHKEILGQDIVFIKTGLGVVHRKGVDFYTGWFSRMLIFWAGLLWAVFYILYQRSRRMQTDVVYARKSLAPRKARQLMTQAKAAMNVARKEEFYDLVFKTLQQYFGDKLHLPLGSVTSESIHRALEGKKVGPKALEDISIIFAQCEVIRYAAATITREDMQNIYNRLTQVIDYMERHVR